MQSVVFSPLLPMPLIVGLAVIAAAGVALALWRGLTGWWLRGLAALVLLAALAGPSLLREDRTPVSSIAIVVVDDSPFVAESLRNFLWVTFTRTNPAADVYGIESFTRDKHWGCHGQLVIDARLKPHHAPPLAADLEVARHIDALAARGGPLHGII